MANKRISIEANKFYHIYNHAVGDDVLFKDDDNFRYFLQKYAEYISPIAKTYAYCLMPNHFHFLISVRNDNELFDFFKKKYEKFKDKAEDPAGFQNPQGLLSTNRQKNNELISLQISKHFGNFFNAYAKAYNKQQNRRGSLFEDDFKRIEVKGEEYLRNLVYYLHYNPVRHGFTNGVDDWQFSSYRAFLSNKITNVEKQEVISWFEDLENFIYFHKKGLVDFDADFD
ncbi:MAG: hypothetical protein GXO49_03340 [Chlorobi bacterium]|nr:hypothetical protein [Chlorobiota bacterium]